MMPAIKRPDIQLSILPHISLCIDARFPVVTELGDRLVVSMVRAI
jgi:hypothetical protein